MINEPCQMCFLSATYEGTVHDKSVADLAGSTRPHGSYLDQDMGFHFMGLELSGLGGILTRDTVESEAESR